MMWTIDFLPPRILCSLLHLQQIKQICLGATGCPGLWVVQNQIADLAAQMEASKKAMITLDKIHRAMCVKESTAEQSSN